MTNEILRSPHAEKRLKSLLLGTLLATAFSVHANGLGDITVNSHLGERLRVEIQLRGNESSPRGPECFHLSNALAENSALPRLSHASMTVLANPSRLVITSRDSVFEPAIELAVFYGCGIYLSRSYTILLSPRESPQPISAPLAPPAADASARNLPETKPRPPFARRTRQPMPGETPEEMAQRLYPRSENYRRRFLRELIALNPDQVSDATIDQPLPNGSALKVPRPFVAVKKPVPPPPAPAPVPTAAPATAAADKREAAPSEPGAAPAEPPPAAATAKAAATPTDRLVLSAPPEAADGALPQVTPEQAQSEVDQRLRDVIGQSRALSTELAAMQRDFPNPPAEVQTRLLEMEARLARMELAAVRVKLSMAQAQPSAEATPPVPAAAPPAGDPAPPPATPAAQTTPAPAAEQPAAAPLPAAAEEESNGFWWGLGILLAFAAALAAYLARNSARRGENGPLGILMPVKSTPAPTDAAVDTPAKALVAGTAGKPAAASSTDDLDKPEPPPEFERSMPGEVEIVEVAHVLAIFGRTPAAIEVLTEFIAQNPDKALNPSLYLLKLYKQTDRREEFKSLAGKLHAEFNVLEITWDDPIEDMAPVEPSARDYREVAKELEKIPHVYSRISEQWGSRECLDYLHDLLHDNRSGQRHGLPLAATNEVLNLIAMLQRELPAATTSGKS